MATRLRCPEGPSQQAESIIEVHKLDLRQFFGATLTHEEMNRSWDFEYLQELLTAEK